MRNVVVAICFFLSGGSGLVFETLWTRKLALVFGSTTLSVASVLTAFMGGLALGSWLLGRHLADRVKRPILWYAAIEGLVGAWGLLVPLVIAGIYPHLNRFLWTTFEPGYFAFSFLRFLFVVLLLLPPTTLMGATLPLLARHFVTTEDEMQRVGRRVGALYTLNTLGAILGTFAAGFLLLPTLGFGWTNTIASVTNLALCGAVLLAFLAFRAVRDAGTAPAVAESVERPADAAMVGDDLDAAVRASRAAVAEEPSRDEGETYVLGSRARFVALLAFGISGFASMNYQVAWNRLLSMVIGSSVYSFTIILLAFLVGIAGGSAIASAALRRMRNPVLWLGLVQLWIGLTAAASYFLADDYPYLFAWLVDRVGAVGGGEGRVGLVMLVGFGVAALAVLPSTLGMGATLPLTVRICATTREHVGRDVGTVYAVNTVGSILGSFASAFVLVPGLTALARSWFGQGYGLQLTIACSIFLNLALAVALFATAPDRRRGSEERSAAVVAFRWTAVTLVPVLALLLVGLTAVRGWTWNIERLVAGSFRIAYLHAILRGERHGDVLYLGDGISTTVTVQQWNDHIALKNNGKVDASTGDDMPTQVMVAGLPLLLHPRGPQGLKVAVIGFGSGVTVGTALRIPVRRVDVIELEPAVIESSWFFHKVNLLPYADGGAPPGRTELRPLRADPRLRVLSNDGRNFLASVPERYDVVVSEPSNPWITGVANLFTLDHFQAAKQALAPGGLFCQWVQLYELSADSVKAILRTFAEAFPYVVVFAAAPGSSDTILVGSLEPLRLDIARIRTRLADPDVAVALAEERSNIRTPDDVPARLLFADREQLLAFTRGATINTDDNAYVEFRAPRDLIRYAVVDSEIIDEVYSSRWRYGRPDLAALRAAGYALDAPGATELLHGLTESLVRAGRLNWAAELLREAAADPAIPFGPDGEEADDLARVLRAGADPFAQHPTEPLYVTLVDALRRENAPAPLQAEVADALAVYRSDWPRPAATAWLLARAAARARDRGDHLSPRSSFLLDVVRGGVEDEVAREGVPIAPGLPVEWQPLLSTVTDREVGDAVRSALGPDVGALTRPAAAGRAPIDIALQWTTTRLTARSQDELIPPDADAHAVRMLMQHVLLVTGRGVPGKVTEPSVTKAVRDWRGTLTTAFDPWASESFVRVLPELTLLDASIAGDTDPWTTAERFWSYVRLAGVRRRLLESGAEWMEAQAPLLPSVEAVRLAVGASPPPAPTPTPPAEPPAVAPPPPPPDPAARYAAFLAAVHDGEPSVADEAWRATLDEARSAGKEAALLEAVPASLAELGRAVALLRAGRAAEASAALQRLLTDAKFRYERPDTAYFAARALWLSRTAAPAEALRDADDHELRGDMLLAWQLLDRWVRGGSGIAVRVLLEGIPVLDGAGDGAAPYIPLVTEQLVRSWFDDNALATGYDAAGIADAFLAGDFARLDVVLAASADTAVRRPPEGEWGGAITDDGELGPYAQLEHGVESLLLFDALYGARQDRPAPDGTAVDAAFERFAATAVPARLAELRASAAFRFLDACRRLGEGDRGAMARLLGDAVPGGAPPGSPLAQLLANSAPARYHLARIFLRCDVGPCVAPRAAELNRALALAGTVARGEPVFGWQFDLRDPYTRAETPTSDLGGLVIEGTR